MGGVVLDVAGVGIAGGGWAVGLGNGTGATAAIETSIPLTLLPAGGTMKALVTATAGADRGRIRNR